MNLFSPRVVSRVRCNHGLEHATINVLIQRNPRLSLVGRSDWRGYVIIGQVETGEVESSLATQTEPVGDFAFSADGSLLLSGFDATYFEDPLDSSLRLQDVDTGEIVLEFDIMDAVFAVALSPDGTLAASGSSSGHVQLWETGTGRELFLMEAHSRSVTSLDFSPDGTLLASAGIDGSVRLWDVKTGSEIAALREEGGRVNGVVFSPDGSLLFSGGEDSTVQLWDVVTGEELAVLEFVSASNMTQGGVTCIALSPDGSLLAVGMSDGTVRLVGLPTATP